MAMVIAIALTAIVSSRPAAHGILSLQEIRQSDAKLLCDAREDASGDQRHEHEEEELRRVAARIVEEFSEELLQLVEEALDIAVARSSLVVRAGAGVVGRSS